MGGCINIMYAASVGYLAREQDKGDWEFWIRNNAIGGASVLSSILKC